MDKRVPRAIQPSRLGFKLIAPMLLFVGGMGAATWWMSESLVLKQTISEGRTVADMVENIGKWASQYGGVHVRTVGANAKIPGNFLTRSVYSVSGSDSQVLQGSKVEAAVAERDALERVEAYHWKNPALIQREVADVISASGSKARYRLTARTVLNKNNAPDAFEREALDAVQAAASSSPMAPRPRNTGASAVVGCSMRARWWRRRVACVAMTTPTVRQNSSAPTRNSTAVAAMAT